MYSVYFEYTHEYNTQMCIIGHVWCLANLCILFKGEDSI